METNRMPYVTHRKMKTETGIGLIHGAGLNGSLWDDLRKELDLPVLTIDFPNRKAGSAANAKPLFADYESAAADQIRHWSKAHPFVIVAHSIGACVGIKIAGQFGGHLPMVSQPRQLAALI